MDNRKLNLKQVRKIKRYNIQSVKSFKYMKFMTTEKRTLSQDVAVFQWITS